MLTIAHTAGQTIMPKSLTSHQSDGSRYQHSPEIASEIARALEEDLSSFVLRAASDEKTSEFVSTECLLHKIRSCRGRASDETVEILLPILLKRCQRLVR